MVQDKNINISCVETYPSQPDDEDKGFRILFDCSIAFNVKSLIAHLESKDVGAKHVRELNDIQGTSYAIIL